MPIIPRLNGVVFTHLFIASSWDYYKWLELINYINIIKYGQNYKFKERREQIAMYDKNMCKYII